jgi:hypothetical protein
MAISPRRGDAVRLREAVHVYQVEQKDKLDKWALKLFVRLADSSDAGKAFARLKLKNPDEETNFLTLSVCVEQLARTFPAHIRAEQKMPARLKRLEKAISELRLFVAEQTTRPPASDLLRVWIGGRTPATVSAMTRPEFRG